MIGLDGLVDALDGASYLPGWTLRVWQPDPIQGPYLSIVATVPNAHRPDESVTLHIHSPIPPMVDDEAFRTWVAWRLTMIAAHEVLEWFKIDGLPWLDPHDSLDEAWPR